MRTNVQQSLNFEVINMIQKTLDVCIGVIGLARHPELYVHNCYNLFFVWCFTETEEDFNVIQSLKETITKQRGQIKGLQSEVKHKDTEVEAVRFLSDLAAVTTPFSTYPGQRQHKSWLWLASSLNVMLSHIPECIYKLYLMVSNSS